MTATTEPPVASDRIQVFLADDHPVYLSGLRMLLESTPMLEVVGQAETGSDTLVEVHRLRPHTVLMDVNMPGINGIEVTKKLAAGRPETGVVMLSMLEDQDTFLAAVRAGARGYVVKGAGFDEISRAIYTVRHGGVVFGPEVSSWAVDHLTKPREAGNPFPELTERERAVLTLVADGLGNASIANRLKVSVKTIRNYLSRIFAKLQIADRTEAAVLARRAGLGS